MTDLGASVVPAWAGKLLALESPLTPLAGAVALLLAVVAYAFRAPETRGRLVAWLAPAEVLTHRSFRTDLKLLVTTQVLRQLGFFQAVAVTSGVAIGVVAALNGGAVPPPERSLSLAEIATLTLGFALLQDFCTYWVHRAHHELPVFWPFHAVHHSAEVLTPVTLARKHPVYDLLGTLVKSVAVGTAQGVVLFALTMPIDIVTLGGANLLFALFNLTAANFRHSHLWISFGPVLERVLVSPAQHQIHHSRAVRHHDKNYGEVFALWDWMFGTLYIAKAREALAFGLADAAGNPIPQPHPDLKSALLQPFAASARALFPTPKMAPA